ncbi:MFS general substrate transporter [Rhizoclosmatium globosum]|uniref:MFS general substrate transporter n=1 Tax=Rhizoclosmatium globosum TaxID=329046 RepID=A0A1Y2BMI6_9FUNG|nr:hypothetical protein HDU79_007055 [Rhizoclosmatium sp. JEL0117]ORY35969.1 MFS general substrate transporter [Rhizoclosmatium globosum]|eukprot:ORY35969.1 MFS general substrate transporter [Rhizoclosmatium globosum]
MHTTLILLLIIYFLDSLVNPVSDKPRKSIFNDPTVKTCILLLSLVPEAITSAMVRPLVPYMIRTLSLDLPADKLEGQIGARCGLFASAFFMPRLVMNIVWGAASDSMGRKPILLLGLVFGGLTTLALGLNTSSFYDALACRFVAGVFSGNGVVVKGALSEIHQDEKGRSWAFTLYGSIYALSGILGPIIGGVLMEKTRSNPFGISASPYFGICIFGVTLSAMALVMISICFRETKNRRVSVPYVSPKHVARKKEWFLFTAIKSPALIINILLYMLLAFCNMFWGSILPLLFSTPTQFGGLGFSPKDASFVMTIPSISNLLCQTFVCEWIVNKIGAHKSFCLAIAMVIPATFGLGVMGGTIGVFVMPVVVICLAMIGFIDALADLSITIMISESAPANALGSAFGLTSTFSAAVRTLAGPFAGKAWKHASLELHSTSAVFRSVHAAALASVIIAWSSQGLAKNQKVQDRNRRRSSLRGPEM